MKKIGIYLAMAFMLLAGTSIQSCKKGEEDPVVSVKTRKDRFTNTWTLNKLEKNGAGLLIFKNAIKYFRS